MKILVGVSVSNIGIGGKKIVSYNSRWVAPAQAPTEGVATDMESEQVAVEIFELGTIGRIGE
jgi:hypothetical protein